jgi:hypothetical protein
MAVLIMAEWPTATFLNFPAARNWFFAPNNFPYFAQPNSPNVRYVFLQTETVMQFWVRISLAFLSSMISFWIGIVFGEWLRRVKR